MYAWEYVNEQFEDVSTKKDFKAQETALYEYVADKLNNTKGVCKKSYIDDFMPEYLMTKYLK